MLHSFSNFANEIVFLTGDIATASYRGIVRGFFFGSLNEATVVQDIKRSDRPTVKDINFTTTTEMCQTN